MKNTICKVRLAGAASLSALLLLTAGPAQAEPAGISYDIPAQSLGSALSALSRRAGVAIIAPSALVEGLRAPPLKGDYETEEAIRRLIRDSGLVAERVGDSYVVKRRSVRSEADETDEPATDTDIVVTGSRIRGAPVASTLVRIEAEAIRNTGQASVADAMRTLPQNFGGGQNPGVGNNVPEANGLDIGGGSSINLRGLGSDATLTLLNGHRLTYSAASQAVDISAIPLEAVDRIEVVADGASALYGADAVAGVANIVLKRDYDGLTARARVGASTDGGNDQQQYSAAAGKTWSSGGFLIAYEFARSTRIVASQRDYAAKATPGVTLFPFLKRHSLVLTGHQEIAPGLTFSLDALYGRRWKESEFPLNFAGDLSVSHGEANTSSRSFVVAPSLEAHFGPWRAELSGVYGKDRVIFGNDQFVGTVVTPGGHNCFCNTGSAIELGGDGPLFALPGGDAQLALGAGWRRNRLVRTSPLAPARALSGSQSSTFAYGELNLPFVSRDQQIGGIYQLNLSAALRYEHYPDVDDVVTPKLGLIYSPVAGFTLKGSWGRSFRAPTLNQLYQNTSAAIALPSSFGGSGFPAGSTVLFLTGGNPALKPERAESWSATAVLEPPPVPGLRFEVGLFHTRYSDRIVTPILLRPQALTSAAFADLVQRQPTAPQVNALLASAATVTNSSGAAINPARVVAIINNLYTNAARQTIRGVDLLAAYGTDIGGGHLALTANASILDSDQLRGKGQAIADLAGTIFNPPHFRGRASATWTKDAFNFTASVNRMGGVADTRFTPVSNIAGMTTFDFAFRYRPEAGLAKGFDLLLGIENAFNKKPAAIRTTLFYDSPYDSTNYSPFGRFVSVTLAKSW